MKITSSRLDDVRREKEDYERDYEEQKARYDEQNAAYTRATRAVLDNIESALLQQINARTSQKVRVTARRDFSYRDPSESLVEVRVYAEDPGWPLRWSWQASVSQDTGEVMKDSNSYSGIEATTPENISMLKESLDVMDYLVNQVDWDTLLHTQLPKGSDYLTMKRPEHRSFAQAEEDALIADCVGQPILVKCTVTINNYRGDKWVKFLSQTAAFYNIITLSSSYSAEELENNFKELSEPKFPQRISKAKIRPVTPFETVEILQ